jgi:hypothetical protein
MANPNSTVHYLPKPFPTDLTNNWRKYIIQASTPNDTRLDFNQEQKTFIPKADPFTYEFSSFPKPYSTVNGITYNENIDICFSRFKSPNFSLWLEKVKVCVHQAATYGCLKLNMWDFGPNSVPTPRNLIEIERSQPNELNIPVTISSNTSLISNVIDHTDLYMVKTNQNPKLRPFVTNGQNNIILPNSLLRFGLQHASSNAYGLKVFLICWALECD